MCHSRLNISGVILNSEHVQQKHKLYGTDKQYSAQPSLPLFDQSDVICRQKNKHFPTFKSKNTQMKAGVLCTVICCKLSRSWSLGVFKD